MSVIFASVINTVVKIALVFLVTPEHDEVRHGPDPTVHEPCRPERLSQIIYCPLSYVPHAVTVQHGRVAHESRYRKRCVDYLVSRAFFQDASYVGPEGTRGKS